MASQNLGQVSGLWIGTSAPTNTTLIWYDSTPAIRCHKVYSVAAAAWVVLDQNVISTITYSELKNLAQVTGLTQGSWYKISDQGNILALAITSTKVQYADVNSNFVIDDLAASATYVVTSSNLLIDDVSGVWDATNKRLKFSFADTAHDGNTDNDYLFGKKQRNGVWSLAKYKLSSLVSAVTGNALSWNRGIFFNFNNALNSKIDAAGGVVGKNTYDSEKATMNQNISNVAASNQAILNAAKNYADTKVAPSEIYNKTLPSAPLTGTAIDIAQGDTLSTIITKIQRWVNQFKIATGMKVSQSFSPYASVADINNNDTVDSALRKIQKWINELKIKLKIGGTQLDNEGIYVSGGGKKLYPDSGGSVYDNSSCVVGEGKGSKTRGTVTTMDDSVVRPFIAGVSGKSSNEETNDPCDDYGGYFLKAKIKGLYLKCRRIVSGGTYLLSLEDDIIVCDMLVAGDVNLKLPQKVYCGKEYKIIQQRGTFAVVSTQSGENLIFSSKEPGVATNQEILENEEQMTSFIYDGLYWHAFHSAVVVTNDDAV